MSVVSDPELPGVVDDAPIHRRLLPPGDHMPQQAIVIDPMDNIAVALADLAEGQKCVVRVGNILREVRLRDKIPFGHKFALYPIAKGTQVRNCGEVIGESTEDIEQGSLVYPHNLPVPESST